MRRILFRVTKNWMFWMILFLSIFSVMVYSVSFYRSTSEEDNYRWNHGIVEYDSVEDLDMQIVDANIWKEDVNSNPEGYAEYYGMEAGEVIRFANETIAILTYLKENNIPYEDITEGNVVFANNRDVRNYSTQILDTCLIFQLLVAVLLLCVIVNQGRFGGAFVFDTLMLGRKTCFMNEAKTYFFLTTVSYVIQVSFMSLLRTLLPSGSKYLLYVRDESITVITERQEYIGNILSMYLLLLFYWALLFLLSQLIQNVVSFLLAAPVVVILLWVLINAASSNPFLLSWNMLGPSVYTEGISWSTYIIVVIVRLLVGFSLFYLARLFAMKKKIQLRYE